MDNIFFILLADTEIYVIYLFIFYKVAQYISENATDTVKGLYIGFVIISSFAAIFINAIYITDKHTIFYHMIDNYSMTSWMNFIGWRRQSR